MKNNILAMLLSLVVALGIWMYVITVVDPESEEVYYDVPVVFDGLAQLDSRDLMITSGMNATLNLRLLGNRTDLNQLDKTNITVLADLSRITEPGEYNLKANISYPSSAGSIEVLEQNPQNITIQVTRRVRKEVPVQITYTGTLPENFVADIENAVLGHKTVTVSGPEEVVDQIQYATITVDLNGKMDTIMETYRHTLCGADGKPIEDVSAVTVNLSNLSVTVPVYQIKEVPLFIKVEEGGGLTEDLVQLTPEFDRILVSGSRKDLEKLEKISLGPVMLKDLSENTEELTLNILLDPGITNKSGMTQVKVKVKMPEMKEREIAVRIQVKGKPEGYLVNYRPFVVNVRVRGLKLLVDKLTANMITVTLDLENADIEPNREYYWQLDVTIPDWQGISLQNDLWVTFELSEEGTIPEA